MVIEKRSFPNIFTKLWRYSFLKDNSYSGFNINYYKRDILPEIACKTKLRVEKHF